MVNLKLFDTVNYDFFKPLSGKHRIDYAAIISLIWDMCKSSPTYSSDESVIISELETYFWGVNAESYDDDEMIYSEGIDKIPHTLAKKFINTLKETGWLEERNGGYGEGIQLSFNSASIAVAGTFDDIMHPKLTTYKGKLFKASALLKEVDKQNSPYETVLREVYDDMNDLNNSLRNLGASIASYIDNLTKNKTPQEVLDLFNEYEDKVVAASYHRFKTSDNLFNYKFSMLDQLDYCRTDCIYKLAEDCVAVEKIDYADARIFVTNMINDIENAVDNMTEIMKEIDKQHILYRGRAVQRAQFLLLADGSIKGKLNSLLKYYSVTITDEQDLMSEDTTLAGECICLTPQSCFGANYITEPASPQKRSPISSLHIDEPLSEEELNEEKQRLMEYIKNAMTSENVNSFAESALENADSALASSIAEKYPEEFSKIIGLHTYSESDEARYKFQFTDKTVTKNGYSFQDFSIRKKV